MLAAALFSPSLELRAGDTTPTARAVPSCEDLSGVTQGALAPCAVNEWTVLGVTNATATFRCCTATDPGRCGVELPPSVKLLPPANTNQTSAEISACCPRLVDGRVPQAFGALALSSFIGIFVKLGINTAVFVVKAFITKAIEPSARAWANGLIVPGWAVVYWSGLSFAIGVVTAIISAARAERATTAWLEYNAFASALLGGSAAKSVLGLMSMYYTAFNLFRFRSRNQIAALASSSRDEVDHTAFGTSGDGALLEHRAVLSAYSLLADSDKAAAIAASRGVSPGQADRHVVLHREWCDAAAALLRRAAEDEEAFAHVTDVPPYAVVANDAALLRCSVAMLLDLDTQTAGDVVCGLTQFDCVRKKAGAVLELLSPAPVSSAVGAPLELHATKAYVFTAWIEGLSCSLVDADATEVSPFALPEPQPDRFSLPESPSSGCEGVPRSVRPTSKFALTFRNRMVMFGSDTHRAPQVHLSSDPDDNTAAWFSHTPMPCHVELQPCCGWSGTDRDVDPATPMVLVASARALWEPQFSAVQLVQDRYGDLIVRYDGSVSIQGCAVDIVEVAAADADGDEMVVEVHFVGESSLGMEFDHRVLAVLPDDTFEAVLPGEADADSCRFRLIPADGSHCTTPMTPAALESVIRHRYGHSAMQQHEASTLTRISEPLLRFPLATGVDRNLSPEELIRRQRSWLRLVEEPPKEPGFDAASHYGHFTREERVAFVSKVTDLTENDATRLVDGHARRLAAFAQFALGPLEYMHTRHPVRNEQRRALLNLPPHGCLRTPEQFISAVTTLRAAVRADGFFFGGCSPEPESTRLWVRGGWTVSVQEAEDVERPREFFVHPRARQWFMYRDPDECPDFEAATRFVAEHVPAWAAMRPPQRREWLAGCAEQLPELTNASCERGAGLCGAKKALHGHNAALELIENDPGNPILANFWQKALQLSEYEVKLFQWGHAKFCDLEDSEEARAAWRAAQPARQYRVWSAANRVVELCAWLAVYVWLTHIFFSVVVYYVVATVFLVVCLVGLVGVLGLVQGIDKITRHRYASVIYTIGGILLAIAFDFTLHVVFRMPAEMLVVGYGGSDMPYKSALVAADGSGAAAMAGLYHAPFYYLQMASPVCLAAAAYAGAFESFETVLSLIA